ncbi:glycosyltransferase [Corynebacterium sp. NPDC060344]|uniref:glycosyltransferase n=1 Tax=Corynebacterium sp. NPDC060344 TaxID=3347101 RepID=UPI00365452E6
MNADGTAAPRPISRIVVVIPAHDEREFIAACVDSVLAAARATSLPTEIRVILDACTDGTSGEVPAGGGGVGVVKRTIDARNVGAARATGVDPRDLRGDVWLAHTDADTIVDEGWLAAQLAHADAGADAVVGTIGVADWGQRPGVVRPMFEKLYLDAPGHDHVHGANLGVRGSAYGWVGGFRPLAESEDVDLVARLEASGAQVVRVSDCRVVTSARVSRRTGGGMSGYLDALAADGA